MKIHKSFISNSSSCSFIVTNKTNEDLDYSELVRDLRNVVDQYLGHVLPLNYNEFINEAKSKKYSFKANSEIEVEFGDNRGDFNNTIVSNAVHDVCSYQYFDSDRFAIKYVRSNH